MVYKSFSDFALAQLRNIREASDPSVMRQASIVVAGEIKRRVENEGKDQSGGRMESKSGQKKGAYSKAWGEQRQKKGRQTSHIDLNYSGKMWGSWQPVPTEEGWGAGFISGEQAKIAGYNEKLFGPIFGPTKGEEKLGLSQVIKRFQTIMKQK
jgi:hypothetical protein